MRSCARSAGAAPGLSAREAQLSELFEAVIGNPIGLDQRFFDAGASSLGLMRFHLRCTAELGLSLSIADLFEHVTIRWLARFASTPTASTSVRLTAASASAGPAGARPAPAGPGDEPIAVIGMAVRLPGATDLAAFWDLVRSGGTRHRAFRRRRRAGRRPQPAGRHARPSTRATSASAGRRPG